LLNEVDLYLCAGEAILLASEFRSPFAVCWDFKGWPIWMTNTFVFIIHFALMTNKTERWIVCIKTRTQVRKIKYGFFGVLNEWILLEISEREQEALWVWTLCCFWFPWEWSEPPTESPIFDLDNWDSGSFAITQPVEVGGIPAVTGASIEKFWWYLVA
jgi:hypothetical protein